MLSLFLIIADIASGLRLLWILYISLAKLILYIKAKEDQLAFLITSALDISQGTGAPNGSVPQNICSSGTFLLAGRCGRNNSPWKESVVGKKIFQGVRGDLKSRIAATGYMYGLLTTQDLNCTL